MFTAIVNLHITCRKQKEEGGQLGKMNYKQKNMA